MRGVNNSATARALSRMVQIGVITEVQKTPLRYKVKFDDQRSSGWLFHGSDRAGDSVTLDAFSVNEQVLCIFPFGSEQGVVLCALYQSDIPQPEQELTTTYRKMPDGAVLQYDSETHHLQATLPEGGSATIKAPVKITCDTPQLYCTGSIKADGDITDHTRSMSGDRAIYDGHDHGGDSGGTTKKPNQLQG